MLSGQKYNKDKGGIGYNYDEASSSKIGEIKFVKANAESSGNGPINMRSPQIVLAAPKINMGPPPVGTPGSEKKCVFLKIYFGS